MYVEVDFKEFFFEFAHAYLAGVVLEDVEGHLTELGTKQAAGKEQRPGRGADWERGGPSQGGIPLPVHDTFLVEP
jgi:hypothetical protein